MILTWTAFSYAGPHFIDQDVLHLAHDQHLPRFVIQFLLSVDARSPMLSSFTRQSTGSVIMLLSLFLFESEFINIVAISFTSLILNELIMVALEITTWSVSAHDRDESVAV
jgi:lipid-A-disaccharide synthase-like uncharacterized protein